MSVARLQMLDYIFLMLSAVIVASIHFSSVTSSPQLFPEKCAVQREMGDQVKPSTGNMKVKEWLNTNAETVYFNSHSFQPARAKLCDKKSFEAACIVVNKSHVPILPIGMGILVTMWQLLSFFSASRNRSSKRLAQVGKSLAGLTQWVLIMCALELAIVAVVNADCAVWNMPAGFLVSRDKIYVIGGWDGQGNDLLEYDIASNTWRDLSFTFAGTPPSFRIMQGFAAAESNGNLYVFGGGEGSYNDDLHEYNIALVKWTDLSSPTAGTPPSGRINLGFAGSDGKLFVFGGSDESSSKQDLHQYDIASGTWTDLSAFSTGTSPSARTSMGLAVWNGKLYVFGGYDGSHKNDLHEYDIASSSWTDLSLPRDGTTPSVRHRTAFTESDGKLYVFGGSHVFRVSLDVYDIQTGTWTLGLPIRQLSEHFEEFIGFAANRGRLFFVATVYSGENAFRWMDTFSWDSQGWSSSSMSLPSQSVFDSYFHFTGSVVSDGKLYAFGQISSGGTLWKGMFEYDIASPLGIWKDVSPNTGTIPFSSVSSALSNWDGKLYVFGGQHDPDSSSHMHDLHEYDIASGFWTDLSEPRDGTPPSVRDGMGFAASDGKLYVFGEKTASRMNDLHAYDIASGSWTDLSSPRVGNPPSAREGMGFAASIGKLYVFGGYGDPDEKMNDLHVYDVASGSWMDLSPPLDATRPSARNGMGFLEADGKLYVFGANDGSYNTNDLHEYDITSGIWSDLSSPRAGTAPSPGAVNFFAAFAGKLYVFGGTMRGVRGTNIYEYDIASRSWKGWTGVQSTGEAPPYRWGVGFLESNDKLFVFGGGSFTNDLHQYDIVTGSWTDLSSTSAGVVPPVRNYMGFEEWNGKLYVICGENGLGAMNSMFSYDIASRMWTDLSSSSGGTPPSPRSHLGVAKWNSKLYIFGGFSGSSLNDLYEYEIASNAWTALSTSNVGRPPISVSAKQTPGFAQSNGKLFVYGGVGAFAGQTSDYGDLHQYDIASGSWTDLSWPSAGTTPSARWGMGFAEWNNKLYVLGGTRFNDGLMLDDLHEYDIASGMWTDRTFRVVGHGTQPVGSEIVAATASNGQLYVFGGGLYRDGYLGRAENPLHALNLDCTPDGTAGCISCMAPARAPSGNAPGSSTPSTDPSSGEVIEVTAPAHTPAPNPVPTFWQLDVWTTMAGLTTAGFGTTARNTFKRELSNLFAASITKSDITIVNVSETTNRRKLLAVGIQVNYLIGGFPSTSEAGIAAKRIEQAETQTYLAAVLRFSPDYINLTSLVSTVSGWSAQTDRPSNTPVMDADPKTVDAAVEGDTDTGGSSGSLPIGAIVGGSFGAVLLLAAAGCFCCVAARGREAPSSVDQVPTNRHEARFQT